MGQLQSVVARTSSRIIEDFRDAAQRGDTNLLDALHTEFPHRGPHLSQILSIACEYGRRAFVIMLLTLYRLFATEMINSGRPIHYAALNGHSEVVAVLLAEVHDRRGVLKRKVQGLNPFHVATAMGRIPTMKLLFSACREAVGELTDDEETCLHLAVKFNDVQAFNLVVEYLKDLGLEHFANKQDIRGDTVLHLATRWEDCEILRTLLNSNMLIAREPLINIVNANGFTALDLFDQHSNEVDNDIKNLLIEAGALRAKELPISFRIWLSMVLPNTALVDFSMETRNLLLTLFFAFLVFPLQVVTNPPEFLLQSTTGHEAIEHYKIEDLLLGSSHKSRVLYTATILGSIFILPLIFIPLLVWPLPLRNPLLVALMFLTMFYCLAVAHILPNFMVLCGSYHVPSYWFMWVMVASAYFVVYLLVWLFQFTVKQWNKWTTCL